MIRTIRLSVDQPVIPDDSTLEHSATSWEVSLVPRFDNDDLFVVKDDKDEDNLLSYEFTYDLAENQPLYIRTKYHYKDGDDEYESNWNKTIPLNVKDSGIKLSSTMIVTPTVTSNPVYDDIRTGELEIRTSDYLLYAGTGTHLATSYRIETLNGKVVFERELDEDNLTELRLDLSMFDKDTTYVIKVKHHSTTNEASNYGVNLFNLVSSVNNLYTLKRISEFKPYRNMYFRLNMVSPEITTVDIEVRDITGAVVASVYDSNANTIIVPVGNVKTNVYYKIYSRVKYNESTRSEYILLEEVICIDNYLVNLNPLTKYRNTNNLVREFATNSLTVNYSYELTNGNILFMKHEDSNIYMYKTPTTTDIVYDKVLIDLGDKFKTKPYFHARELPSGKVLVDVVDDMLIPTFILFDYNPITDVFTELGRVTRDDEVFNTSVSGSLISYDDDQILYVPDRIKDAKYTFLDLEVRKLDITDMSVSKYCDLPEEYKGFVNLFRVKDKAYMIPGSGGYTLNDNKERIYNRVSNDLYEFDYRNGIFTNLGAIDDALSTSMYCIHPVVRKDGLVVLFNNVFSGDYLGNQDTYNLDVETRNIKVYENDTVDILSYRNTLVTKIGNIFRITSRVRDSQKIYIYAVDNGTDVDLKDDDTIDVINDLVVPANKVITIESPQRFASIDVSGTNYDDTGTLRLIIDGNVKNIYYRDLLIYRDTYWEINLYDGDHDDWDNVYIVDNSEFKINYFIIVPEDSSYTVTKEIGVEYITVEDGGELIIDVDG